MGRLALVEVADVVAPDEPRRGAEVRRVLVHGHRALHRCVLVPVGGQHLLVPDRLGEHHLGVHLHQPSGVIGAVELDHPEAAALAAHDHVVVEDDRRGVPVVVPQVRRHGLAVERPQHLGLASAVEGDDPHEVVPRARVDERVAVRVDGGRALDDVAGLDVGQDPLAGVGVHEVDVAVVAAEDRPGAVLPHGDGGLSRPAHPAPDLRLAEVHRAAAHRLLGELVQDLGASRGTGPAP